jgi:hypothetical protein
MFLIILTIHLYMIIWRVQTTTGMPGFKFLEVQKHEQDLSNQSNLCFTDSSFGHRFKLKKKKKEDPDVLTGANNGVPSFLSWSKSICNPGMGIRGTQDSCFVFYFKKVNTLNECGQACPNLAPQMASP